MSTKIRTQELESGKTSQLNAISERSVPMYSTFPSSPRSREYSLRSGSWHREHGSKITYIDGDAGMLLYRGYPVEQLARNRASSKSRICSSTCAADEAGIVRIPNSIMRHTMVNEQLLRFFQDSITTRIPWPWCPRWSLRWRVYHDTTTSRPAHREIFAHRIIAKLRLSRRGLQAPLASLSSIAQRSALLREHAQYVLRGSMRALCDRSGRREALICSSSCMRIMSRTPAPRPCAWRSTGANP